MREYIGLVGTLTLANQNLHHRASIEYTRAKAFLSAAPPNQPGMNTLLLDSYHMALSASILVVYVWEVPPD